MGQCEFCNRPIKAGRFCTGFCAKKQQRIDLGIDLSTADRKLGIKETEDN